MGYNKCTQNYTVKKTHKLCLLNLLRNIAEFRITSELGWQNLYVEVAKSVAVLLLTIVKAESSPKVFNQGKKINQIPCLFPNLATLFCSARQ